LEPAAARAIFLSYASQDAEAVRRICEALRAAGLEVWFDQNELVGGDAWDAKIRGQIGSCALFLPVISAATQARREGYFRIEWRLAAQRTHAMADGTPFLVPIVIDDTRDTDALVPVEFKAVQWTRLAGGTATPAFVARVQRLLGGGETVAPPAEPRVAVAAPARPRRMRGSLGILAALAVVGIAMWFWRSSATRSAADPDALVAQAQALLDNPAANRTDLDNAIALSRRAAEAEPTLADAWAVWSRAETEFVAAGDRSLERRESARTKAEKAVQLAPRSFEARLARAAYIVRANETALAVSAFAPQAEADLKALLLERPGEPRALLALGALQSNQGDAAAYRATFAQLAKDARYAGEAWEQLGWAEMFQREFAAANAAVDRSLALQSTGSGLLLKLELVLRWLGDLEEGKRVLARSEALGSLPSDSLLWAGAMIHLARNEPDEAVRWLSSVPRDWLEANSYQGPTALLVGRAHAQAGRAQAARQSFSAALALVEQRLAKTSDSPRLLGLKGQLLALLDRREEAEQVLAATRELWIGRGDQFRSLRQRLAQVIDAIDLGRKDDALSQLEKLAKDDQLTWAMLAVHPYFAPLRAEPRFQALIARLQGDPRFSPVAKSRAPTPEASVAGADEKSVAVLPFANLSGDATQEYFSDGLTEEILNALARERDLRVPGRASSFSFKGKNVSAAEIAQALNVSRLVEGSVRRSGNKVRISVTLTRARDGFSEELGTFTEELTDIFALQDKVASAVVAKLTNRATTASAGSRRAVNPEAYGLYLQARAAWVQRTRESFRQAEQFLLRALELEPNYVPAMALLSMNYSSMSRSTEPESLAKANRWADRALAADPNLAEALAAKALTLSDVGDFAGAIRFLRRSIEIDPGFASGHQWLGRQLAAAGDIEGAVAALRTAAQLDPLAPRILDNFASTLAHAGRVEEALKIIDGVLAAQPGWQQGVQFRARFLFLLGRLDESLALYLGQGVAQRDPAWAVRALLAAGRRAEAEQLVAAREPGFTKGLALCALGRPAEAIAMLQPRTSFQREFILWEQASVMPRDLPEFHAALKEWGLADAWARAEAWRAQQAATKR
jgi:TolB-like protein/Flp pilus assembly protein TadD